MKLAYWKLINRNYLSVVALLAILLCSLLAKYLTLAGFYNSSFLYLDDTIIFGKYLFGEELNPPNLELFFFLLEWLTETGGLLLVKLSTLIFPFIIALCFAIVAYRATGEAWAAVLLSFFAVQFPVAPDQNYFISGSHPTEATAIFCLYFIMLSEQLRSGISTYRIKALLNISVQSILLVSCTYFSATYFLIPFISLLTASYLANRELSRKGYSAYLLAFWVVGIAPAIIALAGIHSYQYAGIQGWTNYSFLHMLGNLWIAFKLVAVIPFVGHTIFAFIYSVLALIYLAILAVSIYQFHIKFRSEQLKHILQIIVVGMLAAVLVFGPTSITTAYLERYVIPLFLLTSFVLTLSLVWCVACVKKYNVRAGYILNFIMLILVIVAVFHNITRTQERLMPFMESHEILLHTLGAREWHDEDQILFMLPDGKPTMTAGYNHWSTWQLRVLTGKHGVIGLIGDKYREKDLNSNGVFIDKYTDHGDLFWRVNNGRGERIRMIGLEWGRPLYSFVPDVHGIVKLLPSLIWDGKGTRRVPPGGIPSSIIPFSGGLPCIADEYFFIASSQKAPDTKPC